MKMQRTEDVVFSSEYALKKAVMGKAPNAPKMVRPIFKPLENFSHEQVLFENEKMLVLTCPEKMSVLKTMEHRDKLECDKLKNKILKECDALVISLDTEYVSCEFKAVNEIGQENSDGVSQSKVREILSYQLSAYYHEEIVRFLFFSKTTALLKLCDLVGFCAEKLSIKFNRYPMQVKTVKNKTVKDPGTAVPVYVLAYNALADITTLADFPVFYTCLAQSVDIISTKPYKVIETRNSSSYWYFSVNFIGVQNHVPGGLKEVGASVNLPKVELPNGWIEKMDWVRVNNWDVYCEYAINDSDICLCWYLLNYKGLSIPASSPALGAKIIEYVITEGVEGNVEKKKALLEWRGLKQTNEVTLDRYHNKMHTKKVCEDCLGIVSETIHNLASQAYSGGMNQLCGPSGFYDVHTTDYDLQGCYATIGSMMYDVDYLADAPLKVYEVGHVISKNEAKEFPWFMWGFGTVDFKFPDSILYPCIGKRDGNEGIIFAREGTNVYCTWPEVKMAVMMGAEVKVKFFAIFSYKKDENMMPTSMLNKAYTLMTNLREEAAKIYGKKSAQAMMWKLAINGSYGKASQNVTAKRSRSAVYNLMEDLGPSSVTSPAHAAYFTAVPRVFLACTMQQLHDMGYTSYSVTTDGFISDAPLEALVSCRAYGLRDEYYSASTSLRGEPKPGKDAVWEAKHSQDYLLNITTRVNQGFWDMKSGCVSKEEKRETVDAHAGYKIPNEIIMDEFGEKVQKESRFTYDYLNRGEYGVVVKTKNLPNLIDLIWEGVDYVADESTSLLKLNFDFKRKIKNLREVQLEFRSENYTVVNFDTEPFCDFDEYLIWKSVFKEQKKSLRTIEDYINLFRKLNGATRPLVTLDRQVRAALGRLRVEKFSDVNQCVKELGLQYVIEMLSLSVEKSLQDCAENDPEMGEMQTKLRNYSCKWLKNETWKHLTERYRDEDFHGFSIWIYRDLLKTLELLKNKI